MVVLCNTGDKYFNVINTYGLLVDIGYCGIIESISFSIRYPLHKKGMYYVNVKGKHCIL
jgi:hypothetical protein